MTRKLIYFVFIAIALFSCSDEQKLGRITKIDNLINDLEETDSIFKSLDYDTLSYFRDDIKRTIDIIGVNLKELPKDTLGLVFNRYGAIFKAISKVIKKKPEFEAEISFTMNQLDSLKYDVENDLITSELFERYYNDELELLIKLKTDVMKYGKIEEELALYHEFDPLIKALKDSLLSVRIEE